MRAFFQNYFLRCGPSGIGKVSIDVFIRSAECNNTKHRQSEILLNDACGGNYVKLILLMNLHGYSLYLAAKGS